jgi:BirA family biotin operon repressor/biotin-[acetyl-CoA-carboxylase] ligase
MNLFCDCPGQISGWKFPLLETHLKTQPAWLRTLAGEGVRHGGAMSEPFHPQVTQVVVEGRADGSQFDALMRCSQQAEEIPDGTVMLALEGEGFHGQRGRPWRAHAGNLHLSACFHPDRDAGELGMGLTMVPAVAVLQTLRKLHIDVPETGIKWVNDILVRGKKVSGVISSTVLQAGRVQTVVFGVGLNVETVPEVDASPLVPPPSCLNRCWDTQIGWQDVAPVLIHSLASAYQCLLEDGVETLFRRYRDDSLVVGRNVQVYEDRPEESCLLAQGRVIELNSDLSLQLEDVADPVRHGRLVLQNGGR